MKKLQIEWLVVTSEKNWLRHRPTPTSNSLNAKQAWQPFCLMTRLHSIRLQFQLHNTAMGSESESGSVNVNKPLDSSFFELYFT